MSVFSDTSINRFITKLKNPFLFKLMLYKSVPLASFTGVKLLDLNKSYSELFIRYKFLNKNPFNTTYWAAMGMVAEMASGLLLLMYTYKLNPSVSIFVLKSEAVFHKRALGKTFFKCEEGQAIAAIIEKAIATKEPQEIRCLTSAYNENGELVATFYFTWGVKARF